MRSLSLLPLLLLNAASARVEIDFNRDIRPILSTNCFACHGPDEEGRKGDLRLDHFRGATANGALVPGNPDQSELIARVETSDQDDLMPPPSTGHRLTPNDKRLLREWIASGGEYAEHWAYVSPVKTFTGKNAIDHFIQAKIKKAGLTPAPTADPYQLLRRLSLDLTGLPPSVQAADKFAANPSPEAYAAAIEKLLASSDFGEHWARMWLDLARYADTMGYEKDKPRKIWRYRDWLIQALNQDMPYDKFTLHQLAGDLLPDPSTDQILATAFHRNTMVNDEGGTDDEEFRVAAVKDRVDTTMQVWMGLTMACAKCHTHKYDPITIADYYTTYAIFNQTEDADRSDDAPTAPTPTRQQSQQNAELEAQLATLQKKIAAKPADFDANFDKWKQDKALIKPAWSALTLTNFTSHSGVKMETRQAGLLVATGKKPAEDEWKLEFLAPQTDHPTTALRLDILPPSLTGSDWKPANMTIQFKLTLITPGADPTEIKLTNARATYEQKSWFARHAIDDSSKTGWALSGGERELQTALFDFAEPLKLPPGSTLRITANFPYKKGLIPSGLRFFTSTIDPLSLKPVHDPIQMLEGEFTKTAYPELTGLREKKKKAETQLLALQKSFPTTPVLRELPEKKQRSSHVHLRGNFLDQAEEKLTPAVPTAFGALPSDVPPDRAALARWLCSDENPLTARVMANRIWARLFGIGIVETEEDFGSQGTVPSHPKLLDWMAVDYREGGWSLKDLLRTIVTSSTYQQSSTVTPQHLEKDPRNRLLTRGPRFRLSAETVRDQSLAASGLLTQKIGGPSVFPPQPPGVWKSTYSTLQWKNATDEDRYRRGLYTFLKRTSPHPAMSAFDAGSGEVCQIRRIRTNTPLQSLVTLNDPAYLEAAGALATKMLSASDQLDQQLTFGFRQVLIRKPSTTEIHRLTELYHAIGSDLEKEAFLATAGLKEGDPAIVAVASVILNLDEALTKP